MGGFSRKRINPYIAGCDRRRHGKVYITTNIKRWLDVYPLSYFLYDPPLQVNAEAWGLCDQGVSYTESGGYTHAMQIVGRDNYYNAADILMEIVNGWSSVLAPLEAGANFLRKLEPGMKSRRLIFHRGGYLLNHEKYRKEYVDLPNIQKCMLPKDNPDYEAHLKGIDMCASLHWQNVDKGSQNGNGRHTTRVVGEAKYLAIAPMENEPPQHDLALIAWLPIDELDIVDNEEMSDKSAVDKALEFLVGQTALPLFITDN